MPKYVALLRAINVGGHNVKMDYLRQLFESLGFNSVTTFIASGNVIFESTSTDTKLLEKKIENHLQEKLGYQVATFIRSIPELVQIIEYKPFPEEELKAENNTLYIGFLKEQPNNEAKQKILSLATAVDDFHIFGQELYWLCRTKISDSKISGTALEKILSGQMTMRNSTTVNKIASKYL